MGSVASLSFGASNIIGWGGTREMPTNNFLSYSEVAGLGTVNIALSIWAMAQQ